MALTALVLLPAPASLLYLAANIAAGNSIGGIDVVILLIFAIFSSVTAPAIIANRTQKARHRERLQDWEREDKKNEERVKEARRIAEKVAETAMLVAEQRGNAEIAVMQLDRIDSQGRDIHVLVNSQLTLAVQAQLDATRRELALMLE